MNELTHAQSESDAKRLLDALRHELRPLLELQLGRSNADHLLALSEKLNLRNQLATFLSIAISDKDIRDLLERFPALVDYELVYLLENSTRAMKDQRSDKEYQRFLGLIVTTTRYLVEKAKEQLTTWRLIRGEHFLSALGIHPKALEAFDYHVTLQSGRQPQLPEESVLEVNKLCRVPKLIEDIKRQIGGYDSAREFFISQLASKIESTISDSRSRKVIFRTTDFKSDDLAILRGSELFEVKERNPQAGNRGIGRYLQAGYRALFGWELEACRRVVSNGKVELSVLFPFVRWPDQLKQALTRVAEIQLRPRAIGMMVEVPSNIMMIDDFIDLLKGHISLPQSTRSNVMPLVSEGKASDHQEIPMLVFGLADLTQATMVAARDNPDVLELHNEAAPAVVRSVSHVLGKARHQMVQCGIHLDTLESLVNRKPTFAALLATDVAFLVEDCWLV